MKSKSFTLIELLVVIVIIGILAGVIMISTSSSIDKANIAKSKVFEESVQNNLAANMVSRWKLDEVNGTSTPDAWGLNTGTLYGNPSLRPSSECVTDGCFKFNGVGDGIDFGDDHSLKINDKITISFWVKPETNEQGSPEIIAKGGSAVNYRVRMSTGGLIRFNVFGTATPATLTTSAMSTNVFNFIVATYDGSFNKIYKNGILEGNDGNNGKILMTEEKVYLACLSGISEFFKGLIDDVRIYNSALSSAQIKKEYIAGIESLCAKGIISRDEFEKRLAEL